MKNSFENLMTRLTVVLFLLIVLFSIIGCAGKKEAITKQQPNQDIYDGSIGRVLGCMFAPDSCPKIKNKHQEEDITKEFEEMDSE